MKTGYAAIVAIVALLAAIAVPAIADDSDALASIDRPDSLEFDNMSGGDLKFVVDNTRGGSFEMDVVVLEDKKEVASEKGIQIPASQKVEVSIDMGDFKTVGTHTLTVKCTPADQFENTYNEFTVTVEVDKNLLSDWVTYVVILIVVIVIAAFAYLKIRDSPKKKTEMTFEQLEEQRKAEMASKTEKKKVKEAAPTTERQRYLADKKKKKE